jgi:peptide/nickel transport system ATP-binding protein
LTFSAAAPLLRVRDLSVHARSGKRPRVIVDRLNLDLGVGQTIGIVGESGSGKSLTARALCRLLPAGVEASGRAELDGADLLALSERDARAIRGGQISLMPQDPFTMLNPLMRAGDQVVEALRDKGRRSGRTKAALRDEAIRRVQEVGIEDSAVIDRYPFQLSGGLRQRVGLAAALAANPRLLIADEPSTALDVTSQREILELLKALQASRGMSMILITHDLRVAFEACEQIYVLYAGALVEVGSPQGLNARPLHPYTLGLLRSEPSLDRRLERLSGIPGSVARADQVAGMCAFAPRCEWAEDACRSERPPLAERIRGRLTACRRVPELADELHGRRLAAAASATIEQPVRAAPLVEITGLGKSFARQGRSGSVEALRGVSLEIRPGECVGLVGESGSGKTTLGRCLAGLERAGEGSIAVGDVRISHAADWTAHTRGRLWRTVQMVFQDPYSTLNPARSVGSSLREALGGRGRHADVAQATRDLLGRVGLPAEYAARKPVALSGGERQRVAIARALASHPSLLICDEPVSALDVSVQAQILDLLDSLRRALGMSYLFITHDLSVVRQVATRVYVLYRGEIVEEGLVDDVLDRPRHEYTARLLSSVPRGAGDHQPVP